MNFYVIALFSFYCFSVQASDALRTQKVQELQSIIHRTVNSVEHSQLPLTSEDFIYQAAGISKALTNAGCKENYLSSYVHAATNCTTSCLPLYSSRVRYSYTLYTAQQYITNFNASNQDTTRYVQLGGDGDSENF